jgi:protein-S-isoprenylcysteine O-methyltransferase Ste14
LLIVAGIFGVAGLYEFFRNGTSVDPHKPEKATTFVTSGIYQVSRNPMYVALFFILIAYATALQNIINLMVLPLFIWYMNRFQIIPEEEVLEDKFGDAYHNYKTEVNRWL